MTTPSFYIGIDVAKATLEVSTTTARICSVANARAGHQDLIARLSKLPVELVVLEATGCYGNDLIAALVAAEIPVAVAQPGRVRYFARSHGILAKTDPIDACLIARFGEAIRPRRYQPPTAAITHLRALVDRRDQVIDLRISEENHLEACHDPVVARELRASIRRLRSQEQHYTRLVAEHIASDPQLHHRNDLLQEEAGIGPQTAATLLAYLPELGSLNRQEVAAVCGLAPYNDDSGNHAGKRSIRGGRPRLRRALYVAAISASRWNKHLAAWYQDLLTRGKPAKVALIGCARKLIIRLNTRCAELAQQHRTNPSLPPLEGT